MVRDIESLIEFLYLKSINSKLAEDENVIVNPTDDDSVIGKICIINKSYPVPDLSYANKVIDRNMQRYNLAPNKFIDSVNIIDDGLFAVAIKDKVYFGQIPSNDSRKGPCIEYLRYQLEGKSSTLRIDSSDNYQERSN